MKQHMIGRARRMTKTRKKLMRLNMPRLSVHISSQHIYAQVFNAEGNATIACASTLDKEIKKLFEKSVSNVKAATVIGEYIAKRAKKAGVVKVGFDRSGFKYHGRVKALADAAREHGLDF
jgi:large subunit ribosomal protein L18